MTEAVKENDESIPSGPLMCWDFYMERHFQRLLSAETLSDVQQLARHHQWRVEWDLPQLLVKQQKVVLLTDTEQVIRYASPNMPAMNGYAVEEVLGKTPRMFQGKDTDPETRSRLRDALRNRVPFKGTLINYRPDGSPYTCTVEEYPVWNTAGELVNFIAFESIA